MLKQYKATNLLDSTSLSELSYKYTFSLWDWKDLYNEWFFLRTWLNFASEVGSCIGVKNRLFRSPRVKRPTYTSKGLFWLLSNILDYKIIACFQDWNGNGEQPIMCLVMLLLKLKGNTITLILYWKVIPKLYLLFCEVIPYSKLFCLFLPSALMKEMCLGVVPLRARHSRDISLSHTSDDVLKTSLRM